VQYDLQQIPVLGVPENRKSCRMVDLLQHVRNNGVPKFG
jgi:hypothetical protein